VLGSVTAVVYPVSAVFVRFVMTMVLVIDRGVFLLLPSDTAGLRVLFL
jgi:hypothetical protein